MAQLQIRSGIRSESELTDWAGYIGISDRIRIQNPVSENFGFGISESEIFGAHPYASVDGYLYLVVGLSTLLIL